MQLGVSKSSESKKCMKFALGGSFSCDRTVKLFRL